MKMTPEHCQLIKDAIVPMDTAERRQRYVRGDYPNAAKTKDLDKRYRWDLFCQMPKPSGFVQSLYDYMNDDHIDTALRGIVPVLQRDDFSDVRKPIAPERSNQINDPWGLSRLD